MRLNNTWRSRLATSGSLGARMGRPVVLALATLAGLNLVWQLIFGTPTDVVGPARTVVNK